MIKLIDLLNEGKQVGILYHFTSLNNLIPIFQSNCLKDRTASGKEVHFNSKSYYVSFTRNKNFNTIAKIFGLRTGINFNNTGCVCMITVDGDKLSNSYSTEPARDINFSSTDLKSKWSQTPKVVKKGKKYFSADENEERIYINQCIPIKDYTISITLIDPTEQDLEKAKTYADYSVPVKIYNSKTKQESDL